MYKIRILNTRQTGEVSDMKTMISDIENVYSMKSRQAGKLFPMIFHEFEPGVADMDIKSGLLEDAGIFGLKLVSWFGNNAEKGLPLLTGTVMIFDLETGKPVGILSAEHLTGMRTGAAGAIGAKFLAKKNAENLLIVGAGHQAPYQIEASLIALGNIRKVRIYCPIKAVNASNLVSDIKQKLHEELLLRGPVEFEAVTDIKSAVESSQVIITVTPSRKPLIMDEWVQKGTHFSCVGSDMPGKQEIDEKIFARAKIFVDDYSQALNVGECEIPFKKGVIGKDSIAGEIGELISGNKKGRDNDDDITIFDSTGVALQDLMAANRALKAAEEKNIGTVVEL